MELKIKENTYTPIVVENFDEIKSLVREKADHYANLVYTEDDLPQAKKDKAMLNKFIKAIEDRRKEIKKACMQPYESFETQIKELVAICEQPVKAIDEFVKMIDSQNKAEKRAEIEKTVRGDRPPRMAETGTDIQPQVVKSDCKGIFGR